MKTTPAFPLPEEAKSVTRAFQLIRDADQRESVMVETDDAILAAMLLDVVQGLTEAAAILTPIARSAASRATRKARQGLMPVAATVAARPEPPEPKRYKRRSRPKRTAKGVGLAPTAIRDSDAPKCCDTPTPGVHNGQRYCESCDTDLCAICNSPAVAGYSDRGPLCARCWTEGAISA